MNRENIQKWADELQFGDYKQTRGRWHEFLVSNEEAHCALGVASVVSGAYKYGLNEFVDTLRWLGLEHVQVFEISSLNDYHNKSLPEIGAWIRDNWLKEE